MPNEIEDKVFKKTKDLMIEKDLSEDEVEQIASLIEIGSKGLSDGIDRIIGVDDEDN